MCSAKGISRMMNEQDIELKNLAQQLDQLGFCIYAGNISLVYILLRNVLMDFDPDRELDHSFLRTLLQEEKNPSLYLLFLFLLESVGIIEHGGNIRSAFLSEKGTELFELLKKYEYSSVEPYFEKL
jgi:hypothetical protein